MYIICVKHVFLFMTFGTLHSKIVHLITYESLFRLQSNIVHWLISRSQIHFHFPCLKTTHITNI